MAYCDVCGNFDDEHTDGEPDEKAKEVINRPSTITGTDHSVRRIKTGDVNFQT